MVSSDKDLRRVINNGSATSEQLRTFAQDNKGNLGELINNLVTTGEVTVKHLDGMERMEQILVLYPYVTMSCIACWNSPRSLVLNSLLTLDFRWQISLVKVDSRWLVDDFSPVR